MCFLFLLFALQAIKAVQITARYLATFSDG